MLNKILIGIANDEAQPLPALAREVEAIRTAISAARSRGLIRHDERHAFNFRILHEEFSDLDQVGKVRILHYCGHSDKEGLRLYEPGGNQLLGADHLQAFLQAQKGLELVFLNSCYSEAIARKLVESGIPVVIGTNKAIGDELAARIAGVFYQSIAGTSRTIEEAYEATRLFFEKDPADESAVFRGPDIGSPGYPLKIFKSNNIPSNWRLIPRSALDQLNSLGTYIRKVLIVRAADEEAEKYHQHLLNCYAGQAGVVFYELSQLAGLSKTDQEQAIAHFDHVVYLSTSGLKRDLLNQYQEVASALRQIPRRGVIACSGDVPDVCTYLRQEALLGEDSPVVPHERTPLASIAHNLDAFLKNAFFKDLLALIGTENFSKLLGNAFTELNFRDQQDAILFLPDKPLNFIFIEGTPQCGQELLVRRILRNRTLRISKNVPRLNISVDSMLGEATFNRMALLQLIAGRLGVFAMDEAALLKAMVQKLQQEDVVLILHDFKGRKAENVKQVLTDFWQELNQHMPAYEGAGRLFFIVVHNGFDGQKCCISTLQLEAQHEQVNPLVLPVISPLKEVELKSWVYDAGQLFSEDSPFQRILDYKEEILQRKYISNVVEGICEVLDCEVPTEIFDFKTF
jgi:hypothetical protein